MFLTSHIFITGPHRSGGSLLSRMLSAHSRIFIHYSSIKFFTFCYQQYQPIQNFKNLKKMIEDVSARVWHRYHLRVNVQKCLALLHHKKPMTYAAIADTLWKHCVADTKKNIFGEVEASKWRTIPDFLKMFPQGKAILIIRDLRDVVNSFKKHTIAPGNDYLTALFNVIDAMDYWMKFKTTKCPRFYGIRYEELKENPEYEIKKLCQFLQIKYEKNMLDETHWIDQSGNQEWNHRKDTSFLEKDFEFKDPVGRWRKMISKEDLFLCEWIGKKQMQNFGLIRESGAINQDVFNRAIRKLMSSRILQDSFRNWCKTGHGDDKYPLDPKSPMNWDLRECKEPKALQPNLGVEV